MFIERPPIWFRKFFPGALFRIKNTPENPPAVYLTFDDGPIPEATPLVLDILDEFDVKATFFMVGQNVERNVHLFDEILKRGHKAGNHTLHHIRGFGISPEDYIKDVNECHSLTKSSLFRPPHGWLTPSQLREVKKNYTVVMYDLITRDYSRKVSAKEIVSNVKKYTRDGSIIVFHDSLKSIEKLKTALPESLKWLKEQGYQFKLLDEKINS